MTRIGRLFEDLKRDGRKGLIAYLTAGDPTPERTPALVAALERGGADLIELGVPFSDPIADGPVIQRAGERALRAGTTLAGVLGIAARVRERSQIPLLLFTYLNPVVRYGLDRLARDAAAAGIDGCLLTDASVEEAGEYAGAMHRHGLDTVFLAAPTSTERRLRQVAQYSTGFAYLVSRTASGRRFRTRQPRWCGRCAPSRTCRWRWDSASRGPNRWAKRAGWWRRWWWVARSCV
jgi:tryptophan synthase alpha chain